MLISYSLCDQCDISDFVRFTKKDNFYTFRFLIKFHINKRVFENLAVFKVEVKVIEVCELNLNKEVVFVLQVGTAEVSNPTGCGRVLQRN